MFEFIRKNQRISQIILSIIVLPFAFFGIQSFRNDAGGNKVATVAGRPIYQIEFDNALRQYQTQMQQMMGENYKAALFDTPETRKTVLDRLVNQRVINSQITKTHMTMTKDSLKSELLQTPEFQDNGQFSPERYTTILKGQGMTPAQYESQLVQNNTIRQLVGSVSDSAFVSKATAKRLLDAQLEEREVSELRFPLAAQMAEVSVSDAEVKAAYDQNTAKYELPARVRAEYVVFDLPGLEKQIQVSDEEVAHYYNDETNRKTLFTQEEQRKARHILIQVPKEAPAEAKEKAQNKAAEILKKIKAGGDFAKLAQTESDDPGSKSNGGDLGFFGRKAMVKPFEDAVFSLKKGEISDVVQTDFGFHIIQVTDIRPEQEKPLSEAKAQIVTTLLHQKAQRLFAEQVDQFKNTVYEQSDSLKPAEDTFKLKVVQTPWITSETQQIGTYNSPALVQKLFSDDAITKKRNTEAVEVGKDTLISARVVEHQPARRQTLEEVKGMIETRLRQEKAAKRSVEKGQAALADLQSGKSVEGKWTTGLKLQRTQPTLPPEALRTVFSANPQKLPAFVGATLSDGAYSVFRIDHINRPEVTLQDERLQKMEREQARQVGDEDLNAYLADLRKRFNAEIMAKAVKGNKE